MNDGSEEFTVWKQTLFLYGIWNQRTTRILIVNAVMCSRSIEVFSGGGRPIANKWRSRLLTVTAWQYWRVPDHTSMSGVDGGDLSNGEEDLIEWCSD
jgi:hypothetical protein